MGYNFRGLFMADERSISMSEFKTVVEGFQSGLQKITEIVLDTRADVQVLKAKLNTVESDLSLVKLDLHSVKKQVAYLHEGQTEIKNLLKQKANQSDLAKLKKQVADLKNKVA